MNRTIITGLFRITQKISPTQQEELENKALQYRKFFRMNIKIMAFSEEEKTLIIAVSQDRKPSDTPYFTSAEMVERMRGLFAPYFEGYQLKIGATPYQDAPPEIVTPNWIQKKMFENKVSNKQLSADLGVARAEISALANGHREMGIRTKAMFFYYFKSVELQK